MKAEAWATICGGLSSYSGIISAYFFARPVLKYQGMRTTIELLEEAKQHPDDEVAKFADELQKKIHSNLTSVLGKEMNSNYIGGFFLLLSGILLAAAVIIQIIA